MGKRTSPRAIEDANDLSQLGNIVQVKRNGKRSGAKKGRRNRHYEKQLIRNAITAGVLNSVDNADASGPAGDSASPDF